MEGEDKKGTNVPVNVEEAVQEFKKARKARIAKRRARIAQKIATIKNADAPTNGDTASIPSSLEFLAGLDESGGGGGGKDAETVGGERAHHASANKHAKERSEKEEVKKSSSEQLDLQIEESRKQLEQVILDGEVLITNVKVAAEYREKQRQKTQDENHKERLERLRLEAEESQAMYEALSQNWAMKAEKALPMDLYKQMKGQQDACDELLGKKEDLIISMRREIEENDFEYDGNLEKYQKDTMLMGDRIDDLVDDLRTAFIEELNLIEDYTCRNREVILEDNQNEWMELLQDFESMEQKNLEERKSDAVAKFQTLNDLFTQTKQESRMLRQKMEDDLRILIQEREQIKYSCHINLEKMAYNLHILQCRAKENVELKNMMKRFLLQLHDKFDSRAASLKKKMDIGKKQCEKLVKEIDRLEVQVSTFGQKTLHLGLADHRKYMDLWIANEEMVREKVKTLLDSEKFIYETQLGIEFAMPALTPFDERPKDVNKTLQKKKDITHKTNTSMSVKERKSKKSFALDIEDDEESLDVENVKDSEGSPVTFCVGNASLMIMQTKSLEFLPGPDPDPAIQRRLMKSITKVICDQSGFIVEDELQKILSPLLETEKNLVNIDAVLQALGITNVEEMQTLARYMLKYCKIMKGVMSKMDSNESAGMSEMNISLEGVIGKAALEELGSDTSERSLNNLSSLSDSDSRECKVDPTTYCDCMTARAEKQDPSKRIQRKPNDVSKPDEIIIQTEEDLDIESAPISCCPVVCTPTSSRDESLEQAIEGLESDEQLQNAVDEANSQDFGQLLDEQDASFISNKATVMSWLEDVDRQQIVENLSHYEEHLGESNEESNAEEYEMTNKPKQQFDEEGGSEENIAVESEIASTMESDKGDGGSDDESKTISIPSYNSSSDASMDFLYINPEDVIMALQNFIEDYNNRKKVVLPTPEEIISKKLAKIKYPQNGEVADYWENAIRLLDPKGKDLWNTVQYCFEQYNKVLKERNDFVENIGKYYQQNYELSHLLQKHLQSGAKFLSNYPPMGPLDPRNMGYC